VWDHNPHLSSCCVLAFVSRSTSSNYHAKFQPHDRVMVIMIDDVHVDGTSATGRANAKKPKWPGEGGCTRGEGESKAPCQLSQLKFPKAGTTRPSPPLCSTRTSAPLTLSTQVAALAFATSIMVRSRRSVDATVGIRQRHAHEHMALGCVGSLLSPFWLRNSASCLHSTTLLPYVVHLHHRRAQAPFHADWPRDCAHLKGST